MVQTSTCYTCNRYPYCNAFRTSPTVQWYLGRVSRTQDQYKRKQWMSLQVSATDQSLLTSSRLAAVSSPQWLPATVSKGSWMSLSAGINLGLEHATSLYTQSWQWPWRKEGFIKLFWHGLLLTSKSCSCPCQVQPYLQPEHSTGSWRISLWTALSE